MSRRLFYATLVGREASWEEIVELALRGGPRSGEEREGQSFLGRGTIVVKFMKWEQRGSPRERKVLAKENEMRALLRRLKPIADNWKQELRLGLAFTSALKEMPSANITQERLNKSRTHGQVMLRGLLRWHCSDRQPQRQKVRIKQVLNMDSWYAICTTIQIVLSP